MKDGTIGNIDYISFGSGAKNLVLLPGLGDSLCDIRGLGLPMSVAYRTFTKEYTVYMFGRKHGLPKGSTTRDMARDQAEAMDLLGIERADIFGVSMGGMIAQHFAAEYPELVEKLVLVVTCAREKSDSGYR